MKSDTPRFNLKDHAFMRRALELAAKGEGRVEPNPMVGCVIVRRGKVVGEGWHKKFGGPHAEVNALRMAGNAARGATAYVTLEPCSHFGKTPPCADALIRAGVHRVVAAAGDPNPLVSGRGFERLRAAGIQVDVGLLREEAEAVLTPFITRHTKGRPYVILKWAQSIDGKIATRTGDSKWITSIESRALAHELRSRVDGIVVGVETVIADNPELTPRLARPVRIASRIILDHSYRTPLTSKLVKSARTVPTLIVARPPRTPLARKRRTALGRKGCEVIELKKQKTSPGELSSLMTHLANFGMTNVMVEGGGRVLGSFLDSGLADEAHVFVAPRLIGGEHAPGPLRCLGPALMTDIIGVKSAVTIPSGPDLCYLIRFDS